MPAFLFIVLYPSFTLENTKTYAAFNALTIQGRIANVDVVRNEFIAVTVISNLMNDDDGVTIKFTNSNGLMALHEKGCLPKGRLVTLTGHIKSVSQTWINKDGEFEMLKRPLINLIEVQIPTGGLGPMPADKQAPKRQQVVVRPSDASKKEAPLDETPVFDEPAAKQELEEVAPYWYIASVLRRGLFLFLNGH